MSELQQYLNQFGGVNEAELERDAPVWTAKVFEGDKTTRLGSQLTYAEADAVMAAYFTAIGKPFERVGVDQYGRPGSTGGERVYGCLVAEDSPYVD